MITRIVKMTFATDKTAQFESVFLEKQKHIAVFPGCSEVALRKDVNNNHIYFTISMWESESALNEYRNSKLFAETWTTVKQWFAAKAEAWSLGEV